MPRRSSSHQPILVTVSDRVIEATRIKQQARFLRLRHEQDDFGVCTVYITLRVNLFAATENNDFGPVLSGPGFSSYLVELVADNNCLVDEHTGEVLAIRHQPVLEDWLAECDSIEGDTMLQGDFFEEIRETQPVLFGNMIRSYIQQAIAAGKFA